MFRFILSALVAMVGFGFTCNTYAETPDEAKAKVKVRVAMALAAAKENCGACRTDEAECRADATKQNRLLVLFVGGCYGRGESVVGLGAIACRADDYVGDKGEKGKPRIVILIPKDGGFEFGPTLPGTASDDDIKKAVLSVMPKKISIDWYVDADAPTKDAPVPTPVPATVPVVATSTDVPTFATGVRKDGSIYYYIPTAGQPVCRNCK